MEARSLSARISRSRHPGRRCLTGFVAIVMVVAWATSSHASGIIKFLEKSRYTDIRERIAEGFNANKASLRDGRTPLIAITVNKNLTSGEKIDLIDALIKKGADLEGIDHHGNTPLLHAVAMRDMPVTNFLVEQAADVDAVNLKGNTPFSVALRRRYFDIADYLLAKGAYIDPRTARGATPLYSAAREGNIQKVEFLLSRGAQINVPGLTPLIAAASAGKMDMVRFLVEKHGADTNAGTEEGHSPLSVAAQTGHIKVMTYLIDKGAIVNPRGRTPLMAAAAAGQQDAAMLLINKGADINHASKGYVSPLLQAVRSTHYDLARMLIQHRARYPVFDEKLDYYVSGSVNRLYADHYAHTINYSNAAMYYERAGTHFDQAAEKYTEIAGLYRRQAQKEGLKQAVMVSLMFWAETEQARLQTRQHRKMTRWSGVKSGYTASPNYMQTATLIGTRNNTLLMTPGGWQKEMNAYVDRKTIPLSEREKYFALHAKEARLLATESRFLGQCHRKGGSSSIVAQCIATGPKTGQ